MFAVLQALVYYKGLQGQAELNADAVKQFNNQLLFQNLLNKLNIETAPAVWTLESTCRGVDKYETTDFVCTVKVVTENIIELSRVDNVITSVEGFNQSSNGTYKGLLDDERRESYGYRVRGNEEANRGCGLSHSEGARTVIVCGFEALQKFE